MKEIVYFNETMLNVLIVLQVKGNCIGILNNCVKLIVI